MIADILVVEIENSCVERNGEYSFLQLLGHHLEKRNSIKTDWLNQQFLSEGADFISMETGILSQRSFTCWLFGDIAASIYARMFRCDKNYQEKEACFPDHAFPVLWVREDAAGEAWLKTKHSIFLHHSDLWCSFSSASLCVSAWCQMVYLPLIICSGWVTDTRVMRTGCYDVSPSDILSDPECVFFFCAHNVVFGFMAQGPLVCLNLLNSSTSECLEASLGAPSANADAPGDARPEDASHGERSLRCPQSSTQSFHLSTVCQPSASRELRELQVGKVSDSFCSPVPALLLGR